MARTRKRYPAGGKREAHVKCLLDTHFLVWITTGAARLDEFPWLSRYEPWGVSPISLLELKFLAEVGRIEIEIDAFAAAVMDDPRFLLDEVPLLALTQQALPLDWTRDPFDRLLAAHSIARRSPLCTVDRHMLQYHSLVPGELAAR
jgi:PIN domain nuclease of toxin-antitoxin system